MRGANVMQGATYPSTRHHLNSAAPGVQDEVQYLRRDPGAVEDDVAEQGEGGAEVAEVRQAHIIAEQQRVQPVLVEEIEVGRDRGGGQQHQG